MACVSSFFFHGFIDITLLLLLFHLIYLSIYLLIFIYLLLLFLVLLREGEGGREGQGEGRGWGGNSIENNKRQTPRSPVVNNTPSFINIQQEQQIQLNKDSKEGVCCYNYVSLLDKDTSCHVIIIILLCYRNVFYQIYYSLSLPFFINVT